MMHHLAAIHHPASKAVSVRAKPDGQVVVTDGPYMEAKEHIGRRQHGRGPGIGPQSPIACRAPVN